MRKFEITTNRRSRPEIIKAANGFAQSIPNRLAKEMNPSRPTDGASSRVIVWREQDEEAEAGRIASLVLDLNEAGVPFRDIGVLVRTRAAYGQMLEQFGALNVPVLPGGRTGLFEQPVATVLARTYCWLTNIGWQESLYHWGEPVELAPLLHEYTTVFELRGQPHRNRVKKLLEKWRAQSARTDRSADLVGDFYELLDVLEIRDWDFDDPIRLNILGTLARFTSLLADYERVRRRARPDVNIHGEQVGGEWGGAWYYKNLAIHIVNYAQGTYEGFDGEPDLMIDAVDITTVHGAKGLEWPAVFLPSLTSNRFPSSRTGEQKDWLVPRELFNAAR